MGGRDLKRERCPERRMSSTVQWWTERVAEIYREEEGPRTEGVQHSAVGWSRWRGHTDGVYTTDTDCTQNSLLHVSAALEPRKPKRRHKLV